MKILDKAFFEIIKTQCSGRVYAMRAPQNATEPFCVFQETNKNVWRSINNPSEIAQANIQVDVYARTLYDAKERALTIEGLLDGYRGTVSYGTNSPQDTLRIAGISLQSAVDIFDQTEEPFLYRRSMDFLITYEQGV